MAKILDMPKLSPTMEEGVLTAWHKKEGDTIGVDDLLAEVETDKATMEFRSFDRGTLRKLLVAPGSTVKLGQAVAIVGDPNEDISALLNQVGGTAPSAPLTAAAAPRPEQPAVSATPTAPVQSTSTTSTTSTVGSLTRSGSVLTRTEREPEHAPNQSGGGALASPFVRKTARERGLDLNRTKGSGPFGRILPSDLDATTAAPQSGGAIVPASTAVLTTVGRPASEAVPLSPMRRTIARRLTESKQTVPHFYLTIDVDVTALVAFREQLNRDLQDASGKAENPDAKPIKISINDCLIKACAIALTRVPECNATFTPEALLFHKRVDISVAVAIPDGLVTPVVRDANNKSITAIAKEVRDLATRARAKKLKPEEMADGTFSISNLGMFGIDTFSAVINPPEGAILAVGQVRDEPVVQNGQIVAGKKLSMTLSCDHRVIDGAVGSSFLAELRALLSKPIRILTE
jgi:pyruvate dehydrogenase E2 component (dihydrolipoamide acetyltransferase)